MILFCCDSGLDLEEISTRKKIKTNLKKRTYEQLYNLATSYPKSRGISVINSFVKIFSLRNFGEEAAKEYDARLMSTLARKVIAEKYPNRKQPTQLADYL